MAFKLIVISLLVGAIATSLYQVEAHGQGHGQSEGHGEHDEPPKYNFKYEVKDQHFGDRKSHEESRDGDKIKGSYTVKQPDGTLRTVEYTVEGAHGGFNAVVHTEPAQKPQQPTPQVKPVGPANHKVEDHSHQDLQYAIPLIPLGFIHPGAGHQGQPEPRPEPKPEPAVDFKSVVHHVWSREPSKMAAPLAQGWAPEKAAPTQEGWISYDSAVRHEDAGWEPKPATPAGNGPEKSHPAATSSVRFASPGKMYKVVTHHSGH